MLVFVIIHLQLLGIFLDTMYAPQIITAIRGGIATTSTFAARPAISPIPYCDKVSRFLSYFLSFLGQKPVFLLALQSDIPHAAIRPSPGLPLHL